jgi:hypothetical protein
MIKKLGMVILVIGLVVVVTATAQRPRVQTRGRVVNANQYPGGDVGAKINAADRDLGTSPGEIVISGGGTISTPIVLSSDHTLRVLTGTYVSNTTETPILMKPRTSIIGSGWDAIILESTVKDVFTVIGAYNAAKTNGTKDNDLLIRDIQVKGANPGFHSAPQAISLGNCVNCTVDHVWVNRTRAIGIQLGGSGSLGFFADNSKVINCLFTSVASQNLALVNGRNILFENNRFIKAGQRGGPGSTNIDLEPNEASDRLQNITIRKNLIDVRDSETSPTGNGIVIQATSGTTLVGGIIVEDNTIIGGSNTGTITNFLSNGIYVFGPTMRDVIIRNNTITRTGQSGINIGGDRLTVINNKMTDVAGGGTPGFVMAGLFNSRVTGNSFTYTGRGPADGAMIVSHGSRGNIIEGNIGMAPVYKD